MEIIGGIFLFVLGAIIGSFLNVVILRYGTRSLAGRSGCFSCGKTLRWHELFPILSFIWLRGRCRNCKSKISLQYPLVEFLTGLIFLGVFLKFQLGTFYVPFLTFYVLAVFSILLVIAVYDLRHKIIPDGLSYCLAVITFLGVLVTNKFSALFQFPGIFDLLAGPIMALPFVLIWFFSRGRWMGFGDAKLALGLGWFLGFPDSISAFILAFWIGAFWSVSLMFFGWLSRNGDYPKWLDFSKAIGMKSEIPLAPFLILAAILVFFFDFNVFSIFVF